MTDTESGAGCTHHELIADGGMDIQAHDGDLVREAINRAEYVDHTAVGDVDGYEVFVHARVTDESLSAGFRPKLTVHVGGEFDRDQDVHLGGSTVRQTFDTLWDLDEAFGELCREHDLVAIEGVGDDE